MKNIAYLMSIVFLFLSGCDNEEDISSDQSEPCYSYWTKGYKRKTYSGGSISITDRKTNETCHYSTKLTINYSSNEILSVSVHADVETLFDLCSYGGVSGYVDECRLDYLYGEKIYSDSSKQTIFMVNDGDSLEGSGQIFESNDSGKLVVVADLIFSVPI